ncbi:MAG: hypothetical protein ACFCUQ_16490 [Kiloniellales bacterium]
MSKLPKAHTAARSGITAVECAFVAGLILIACVLAWDALGISF